MKAMHVLLAGCQAGPNSPTWWPCRGWFQCFSGEHEALGSRGGGHISVGDLTHPDFWNSAPLFPDVPNASSTAHCWKGGYSRDKYWWKRKSCFIQEPSNLGRWWANVLSPSPSCQLGDKGFKGRVREGAAGHVSSLCTVLRLVGIKVKSQASPVFWFQMIWGLSACGQQFSSGGGLPPVKTTQECVSGLHLYPSGNWEFGDFAMWLVYSV